jgi:hypothetical protein
MLLPAQKKLVVSFCYQNYEITATYPNPNPNPSPKYPLFNCSRNIHVILQIFA